MDKITRHNYEAFLLDYLDGNLDEQRRLELEEFFALNPDLADEMDDFHELKLNPDENVSGWNGLKIPTLSEFQNNEELRNDLYFRCAEEEANVHDLANLRVLMENETYKEEYQVWTSLKLSSTEERVNREGLYQLPLNLPITAANYEDFLVARTEGILSTAENEALKSFAAQKKLGSKELALADRLKLQVPRGVFFPDKDKLKKKEKRFVFLYRAAAIVLLLGLVGTLSTLIFKTQPDAQYAQRQRLFVQDADTLEKIISKPIEQSLDSIPKQLKTLPLEEWELLEPDPAFVAGTQKENTEEMKSSNDAMLAPDPTVFDEIAEVKSQDTLKQLEVPEIEIPEIIAPELPSEEFAELQPEKVKTEFQTIGEIAEERVASTFDLTEEEKDAMALSIAKKITQKAGEALDSEITKETDDENDRLTYSLRIRRFKVTHNRAK